jgi:hypothetical protein
MEKIELDLIEQLIAMMIQLSDNPRFPIKTIEQIALIKTELLELK